MRLRGRRHWRNTVQLQTVIYGSGSQAGRIIGWADVGTPARAAVQKVSATELMEMGLNTGQEMYWVRMPAPGVEITPATFAISWKDRKFIVRNDTGVNDDDVELLVERVRG